jgi:signal transduction histidine kinase
METLTFKQLEKLGNISHDLKRPLASAILSLHTLKDGYLGEVSPDHLKVLEAIADSLDEMEKTIEEQLDKPRRDNV